MNKYKVKFERTAEKSIKKLDNSEKKKIKNWIDENLEGTINPRQHGKQLKGNLKTYWRYRVDKYRILADIQDDVLIILVVDIDKRDKVYK